MGAERVIWRKVSQHPRETPIAAKMAIERRKSLQNTAMEVHAVVNGHVLAVA